MTMGGQNRPKLIKRLPWETVHIKIKVTTNKVNLSISDTSISKRGFSEDDKTTKEGRGFHKRIAQMERNKYLNGNVLT